MTTTGLTATSHSSSSPSLSRKRKVSTAYSTIILIATLLLLIVGQFILLPLVIGLFIDTSEDGEVQFRRHAHGSKIPNSNNNNPSTTQSSLAQRLQDFSQPSSSSSSSQLLAGTTTGSGWGPPRRRALPAVEKADGTFNGVPMYLQTSPAVTSRIHCVGENYQPTAWMQRSCRFSFLCLNLTTREYVIFPSQQEMNTAQQHWVQNEYMHVSSTMLRWNRQGNKTDRNHTHTMSIGGINQKWGKRADGYFRLEWFPDLQVRTVPGEDDAATASPPLTYYVLPEEVVLIPFHSLNGANPGHLVWDDFLPAYTLMHMFQWLDRHPLLMRYVLSNGERGLWASCDLRPEKTEECQRIMAKFWPLLAGRNSSMLLTTNQEYQFRPKRPAQSDLVCAHHGAAGMGAITDHGLVKSHGWAPSDYVYTHNHGRGGDLLAFRNYMMQNMGFSLDPVPSRGPHHIIFSTKSSDIWNRNLDFVKQKSAVQAAFPDRVHVHNYTFKEHSLVDQLSVVHQAAIYVTLCGGGAVTGMMLPAGASVILYYSEDGGAEHNRRTFLPALLDWDLFNAVSHLRVHWMPRNTMDQEADIQSLVTLIEHELDLIESQTFV